MLDIERASEEKRGLVIVPEYDCDAWLDCKNPEVARAFLRHLPAEQMQTTEKQIQRKRPATGHLFEVDH